MTTFTALPTGEPDAGAGVVDRVVADTGGGFPCRRCLRDAAPGDELLLLGYDPFAVASPYAGRGPVYVHAGPCPAHVDDGELPPAVAARSLLSVRGYDAAGRIVDTDVLAPAGVRARATAMLEDAGADFVHVHCAGPGCFLVRMD
jgi:hypothetical protein